MAVSTMRIMAAVLLLVGSSDMSLNAAHNYKGCTMQMSTPIGLSTCKDNGILYCVDPAGRFYGKSISTNGNETEVVVSPTGANAIHPFRFHAVGSPVSMSVSISGAVAILTLDEHSGVVCSVYSQSLGKPVFHIACGGYSSGVSFSPDGSVFALGRSTNGMVQGQKVDVYSTRTFERVHELRGFSWGHVSAIAFSPDGKHIAATSISGESLKGELLEWDLTTGNKQFEVSQQGTVKEDVDAGLLAYIGNSDILCGFKRYHVGSHTSTDIPLKFEGEFELKGVCRVGNYAILVSEDLDRHCMVLSDITSSILRPARRLKLSAGESIVSVCANTATVYLANQAKMRTIKLDYRDHKIIVGRSIP